MRIKAKVVFLIFLRVLIVSGNRLRADLETLLTEYPKESILREIYRLYACKVGLSSE